MKRDLSLLLLLGAIIIAITIPSVDASKIIMSGGDAFCQLLVYGGDTIICSGDNSTVTFTGGDNISLTAFPSNDTLRIDAVAGANGESNTASNVGLGDGWFKQKVGVDLEFLSILSENGIIITNNTNDLTLGLSNVSKSVISTSGTWVEADIPTLPKSKISAVGTFGWAEISKTGSSIHDLSNVTSTGCAEGQSLSVNASAIWDCINGAGEINTQSSPTHANTLVLAKSGVDLPIKGIACTNSIICTNNSTDITIDYTATGSTGSILLISANETDQTVTVLDSDTIVRSYSLANNTYSRIIVESEVEVSFGVLSIPQDILIKIKDGGSTQETVTAHALAQIGTSAVPIKVSFVQTGSSTITITQSGITSDANTNVLVHSIRIYGVT